MLQLTTDGIVESIGGVCADYDPLGSRTDGWGGLPATTQTVCWNSCPVYVYTDKTAKAIELLKKLQTEKWIDVKSVPQFIQLVEQISGIL
jgi:hypothetical protein